MLVMMVMLMIMIMIMIMKMMMIMVIDTSCTAWSNCFLVITTFLGGMFGRRFFLQDKVIKLGNSSMMGSVLQYY